VLERVVVGVIALAAVLVAVVALRLMAGPVDLEFMKSRVAQEFDTPAGKMRVQADRIYAEWGGISQPMRLVATGLHVTDAQMHEVATAPAVALSFEPRSVVRGLFLPRSIIVQRPTLIAEIDREGGMLRRILAKHDAGSQGEVVELLIEQLLAEPNHRSLLGQLDTVEVEHATVTVRDAPSGVTWIAPAARASLKRDAAGVIMAADARFSNGAEPVDVAVSGTYGRDRSRISVEAKIDGLKPSMLADLSRDAAILRGINIALSGRLELEADGSGDIKTVAIDVTAGAGTLNLPGILPVAHRVRSVHAHAAIDATAHTARISNIDVDLGTAKVSVTGDGTKTAQGQLFTGRAELKNIPVDKLADYWPLEFATGGRDWAIRNLSDGTLDIAAEFGVAAPNDDISMLSVTRNVAFLDYRDMTVHYMSHMPELRGVSGRGRYEGGTLHFDVDQGNAVGLRLAGATVDLTGLSGPPPQFATVRLPIFGSAPTVMALLARPRLGLPKEALYDPKQIAGDVAVNLMLAFPLLDALAVSDIDIKADAVVSAFARKAVIGAVDLTDGNGHVTYADSQLVVTGQAKLEGHPVEIASRELFTPKSPYRQRYEVKGTVPSTLLTEAGLPSTEPYLRGPVGLALTYVEHGNGSSEVTAKLDLKAATADLALLEWTKEAGKDGHLTVGVKLAAGAKLASADFEGHANGLKTKGQVRFGADSAVQQVDLQQIAIGRSDLAINWKRAASGFDLALKGKALEWSRVRQVMRSRDDAEKSKAAATSNGSGERIGISVQLDQLLVQRGTLGSVSGRVDLAGDRIAAADLLLTGGKGSALRITPANAGEGQGRRMAVYVPDFGLLLSSAGWLDGFKGSFLDFTGQFNDGKTGGPLDGSLRLGPYRLEKVSPRADVGSLNSTIDGLGRAGNPLQQFNGFDAKVNKIDDRIDIRNARTSGPSIGLTANGWLDVRKDRARLRGVVVPAFALNNLLSNVPLLGPLLTGGKDAGLFAIAYRLDGSFDDLKLDINMMSAVTPGALRELFTAPVDGATAATPATTLPPQDKAP
jgi:hypothetical protein